MRAIVAGRAVAGLGVALALTLSASACGGGVDKGKLVNKMKSDAAFKGLKDSQVKCLADVAVKYGKKDQINKYIDGKEDSDGINASSESNNKKAEAAAQKCVK
jgi:hypothetical protein